MCRFRLGMLVVLFFMAISCHSKVEVDSIKRLREKAQLAKTYCANNNMNVAYCVLVDMQIHSGKKRLFLWDFKGDSVVMKGMCSHGACKGSWNVDGSKSTPQFSNVPDSHCSSLGKYRLGKRGYSNWGIHVNYKLHGLEKTNDKAYQRYIVFHSWGISEEETYPKGIAESWGCPAVANNFMKEIDAVLKTQKKELLFWIYN